MKKTEQGNFEYSLNLPIGTYKYKFNVDGALFDIEKINNISTSGVAPHFRDIIDNLSDEEFSNKDSLMSPTEINSKKLKYSRNNYINSQVQSAGEEGKSNLQTKMDESTTNSKTTRKQYLDSLAGATVNY